MILYFLLIILLSFCCLFQVSLDKIISHDPGEWPVNLSAKDSDILVQRGPEQISGTDFPVNKDGRRFSAVSYTHLDVYKRQFKLQTSKIIC